MIAALEYGETRTGVARTRPRLAYSSRVVRERGGGVDGIGFLMHRVFVAAKAYEGERAAVCFSEEGSLSGADLRHGLHAEVRSSVDVVEVGGCPKPGSFLDEVAGPIVVVGEEECSPLTVYQDHG